MQSNADDSLPTPIGGTVYGTLLNDPRALAALGEAVKLPPYKAPPKAPVLYIKPRNTRIGPGDAIIVPEAIAELEIGASLGIVIGRTACNVAEAEALSVVAGYTVCNDVSVPHASFYRPSLRFKCRDTFMAIASCTVPAKQVANPDALAIEVRLDGRTVQRAGTAGMRRGVARLIADVSEFMTLSPGDVLMLGVPFGAPLARAGQQVWIGIAGIGTLENPLLAEVAA